MKARARDREYVKHGAICAKTPRIAAVAEKLTIGEGPSGESQQELEWSIYHWRSAMGCARRLGLRALLRNGTDARQGGRSSTDTDTSKSSDSD